MVAPCERNPSISDQSSVRICGSRPTVGSSSRIRRGWCTSPRASSRRRRMPPESLSTSSARRPVRRASSSPWSTAARTSFTRYSRAKTARLSCTDTSTSRLSSCGTTPIRARASLDCAGSSWSSTRISPSSAIAWPVSSRMVVDLPAPLGPSRPRQIPPGTSRSRPSTAVIDPKRLTTPRSWMTGELTAIDLTRSTMPLRMRALQITELSGPRSALAEAELPEPEPSHMLTPGSEVGGVVRSVPDGASVSVGDRVAAFCMLGGFAEVAVAPEFLTFPLSEELDFAQGAGLILNYHTAYFALVLRGRFTAGESVLVHGAAGGVGTATLQVAKGLGARTLAVVSTDEKEQVARDAGADEVVRSDGPWKDEAKEWSGGGVDIVIDPVGGDRFTDSLRSLAEGGRAVVVGFTGGSIPEVKVNRLLLNNLEVIGAGWGAYVMGKPDINREIGAALGRLVDEGFLRPIVGARFPLDPATEALKLIDGRAATGKVVLELR